METAAPFIVGFQEWVGLPTLGLPSLKAKLDTGAKTSALHATRIETYLEGGAKHIRFTVQPVTRMPGIEIACHAPLVDVRSVTSSNGDRERRFVISTLLQMGERQWEIELTLTNREGMRYRMLIGRQGIGAGMLIDANASFRQPRRSHKVYRALLKRRTAD